ncbi:MAG TPA: DUF4375 domain-containing protein [Gemmataceae bacterium]|nr:DUF4375 domain-containing protein [Gemmataceae bacterium]
MTAFHDMLPKQAARLLNWFVQRKEPRASMDRLGIPGDDCERVVIPLYKVFHARYMEEGVPGVLEWLAELPVQVRYLFTAHACWIDAFPSGLLLFYHLSHGILAPEAVDGFRALGMPECAETLAEANAVFGPEFPRELQVRNQLLKLPGSEEFRDFTAHDERFFAALEREEGADGFMEVVDRYARENCVEQSAATDRPRE